MRYRKLEGFGEPGATLDYVFGQGSANFFVDDPQAVAQSILTRLKLMTGEWFLDKTEGTPYAEAILGEHKKPLYDLAIQERVLKTRGVVSISDYASTLDPERRLTVSMKVLTAFSSTPVLITFPEV